MTKLHSGDWVVVCDGRKALLLENRGDDKFPDLRTKEVHEHEDPPTRELGQAAPGRVQPAVGTARSSIDQPDWHDEAERAFLAKLAQRLDGAIAKGETTRLVVFAAPRALGMLRHAYSPAVRAAVKAEVAKDCVKMPIGEIEKQFIG